MVDHVRGTEQGGGEGMLDSGGLGLNKAASRGGVDAEQQTLKATKKASYAVGDLNNTGKQTQQKQQIKHGFC